MAIEKWLAITSVALFAMFAGEMISIYSYVVDPPENAIIDDSWFDSKIFQFISIGVAPAGILAAVPFFMTKQYGSKSIGGLIVAGGVILLVGMIVCYMMLDEIDDNYITNIVRFTPVLFMILSPAVIIVGAYLTKQKKVRPKKEFF
ncbi:hypothetical protein [Candidatus Nitrosopumilus sediminis]|uniref:Uncharacterized protein n=1 Tax=Candidatus Nitrosopumilus sediminis TaxID=1229909 RepID=K0BDD9_9ARCH|nr:hypothetical protein [Candidatus Nitrosopumilus sediminis]AFS82351.1 hypothetical protein NSED_02715 [Candidatus Nitrosopumilus sediminis]